MLGIRSFLSGARRAFRSLRVKLIIASLIVEAVMLAMMIGNGVGQAESLLEDLVRTRRDDISAALSHAVATALEKDDRAGLQNLAHLLAALPDVEYLVVMDGRGHVAAADGTIPTPLPAPGVPPKEEDFLHVRVGLETSGRSIGTLHYGMSLRSLRQGESLLVRQSVFLGAAAFFLSAIGLLTIMLLLTRRLETLTAASEQLAAGNYDVTVEVGGNDEVAALAKGFNAMTGAVRTQIETLNRNALAMRHSNAELTRLAEVTAHHLQEPLRRVVSFSQLLMRDHADALDAATREQAAVVVAGALHMKRLLGDLQSYVSLDVTPLAGSRVVNLTNCARRAVADLGVRLAECGGRVDISSLPMVVGDAGQLTAAFRHLIANAIDHRRPDAAPEVRIAEEPGDGRLIVTVRDQGPGIAAAYRERVLRIFERGGADTPKTGAGTDMGMGTGIGLALVRKIMECHGGHLCIGDNSPAGAALYLEFPRPEALLYAAGAAGPQGTEEAATAFPPSLQSMLEQARRSEERLRLLLKTASDGIHVLDRHGYLVEASDVFLEMLGYSRSEAMGLNVADWEPQVDRNGIFNDLPPQFFETRRVFRTRHRRRDGSFIDVEVSTQPVILEGVGYLYASSRDISDSVRADLELKATNHRLNQILDAAADGIVSIDTQGRIVNANLAAAWTLGWPDAESLVAAEVGDAMGHRLADGRACVHGGCSIRATLADGRTRRVTGETFTDEAGHPVAVDYVVSSLAVEGRIVGAVIVFHAVPPVLPDDHDASDASGCRAS